MSEYIKREDAYEWLIAHLPKHQERIEQILNDVPSIELVRCKDCIYKDRIMCIGLPLRTGYSFEMSVSDDDYCSYGERKDEEDE